MPIKKIKKKVFSFKKKRSTGENNYQKQLIDRVNVLYHLNSKKKNKVNVTNMSKP